VARRFATNCLTEQGMYQAAMDEYDSVRSHTNSQYDSLMALIDYLSVEELALGGVRVDGVANPRERMRVAYDQLRKIRPNRQVIVQEYSLNGAYPNPFNSTTTIRYSLPEDARIRLTINDVMGREVTTLVNGECSAGTYTKVWNGANRAGVSVASGTYYLRIESDKFTQVRKLTLIK